jgi:ankyrin repeat protein
MLLSDVPATYTLSKEIKDKKAGDSLLHFAVNAEMLELVKFLVERGAKWKTKNAAGVTALELAFSVKNDNTAGDIVDLFLGRSKARFRLKIGSNLLHLGNFSKISSLN